MTIESSRLNLQSDFETFLGSRNVYFQPPENLKINYPCIIYELSRYNSIKADNIGYRNIPGYTVLYISKDPDDENVHKLMSFSKISFDRHYESNGLHHWVYTLYYLKET